MNKLHKEISQILIEYLGGALVDTLPTHQEMFSDDFIQLLALLVTTRLIGGEDRETAFATALVNAVSIARGTDSELRQLIKDMRKV